MPIVYLSEVNPHCLFFKQQSGGWGGCVFVLGLSVWGRKHNPTIVCFVLAGSVLRGNIILKWCVLY